VQAEVVQVVKDLVAANSDVRALVFECSDLPPFANAAAHATGLPVFDFISLAHLVNRAIQPARYPGFWAQEI
jgi:hypothetical protein